MIIAASQPLRIRPMLFRWGASYAPAAAKAAAFLTRSEGW